MAIVRAYVDADGSGAVSAGDALVSGATITLLDTRSGGTLTAQTDASGVARFDALPPGSYTVTMSGGTLPAGAVLATATNPTLVAPFRGDSVSQEFRFVLNPGTLAGQLFRDNNANGVFDTGDTPAPGMTVRLFSGTDTTAAPLATSSTNDAGEFTFTTLRPGAYTVVVTPLPTMTLVGGNVQQVTVGSGTPTAFDVLFTGNLISTISEIRDLPLQTGVAVVGVVTVGNGVLSGSQFYVQDATGGILVFGSITPGTQTGDSVRVVGAMGAFSGESQIVAPTGGSLSVERLGTGTVPAPRLQTVPQLLTGDTEGELVKVPNVEVVSVSGSATSSSYNVVVKDAAGTTMTIRVAAGTVGIPQPTWEVGRRYDVTGLVSMFNSVPQLKPRSLADVEARSAGTPIGEVRAMAFADSAGTRFDTVTVEAVVTAAQRNFGSTSSTSQSAYAQDGTGGILLFGIPADANLEVGDSIRVTGAIDWFGGELEVARFSSSSLLQVETLGTGTVPSPRTISGEQMLARTFESQLVRLGNVQVDSIGSVSSSGGYTVWVLTADGSRVQVRIENSGIGIPASSWTLGDYYTITGLLSRFGGHTSQLKPRSAADVVAGSAAVQTIEEARAFALNSPVTVEGVVIVAQGTFNAANVYIQDPTGGLQVFNVPTDMDLEVGELVRVSGLLGQFNQERQIVRFSSSEPPVITRLGFAAVPAPIVLSGAAVLGNAHEGELAMATGLEVKTVGTQFPTGTGSYNVTVTAPDGTTFTIRIDNRAVGITPDFWVVGGIYDVTGVLGSFNGGGQLKPRSPADAVRR
ncbi:MAG TPA: SdrD B-like domain-containing protein [Longimicrobiales bacterium]|nr:SdrD B-like domain-containing protein [Longimicrobiales bacterium]